MKKKLNKNYKKIKKKTIYIGTIDHVHPNHAYFISPNLSKDLRITTQNLLYAWHKDTVKITLSKDKKGKKKIKVVNIIQRHHKKIVVTIQQEKKKWIGIASRHIYHKIFIKKNKDSAIAENDKVIIHITQWPTSKQNYALGTVVKNLGCRGNYNTEMQTLMISLGLKSTFDKKIDEEIKSIQNRIKITENNRKDYRNITTFTIDPEDAQDFDDAFSVEELSDGKFSIGVHIADVSHYIRPETDLDQEAFQRGNTVYMVNHTVPMLPPYLSHNVCSLVPQQDRLAFSIVFEIDLLGNIKNYWIGKTIIHSKKRFTYYEAQKILDEKKEKYYTPLSILNNIAIKLRQKRFDNGSIHFHTQEMQFQFDKDYNIINYFAKSVYSTHHMVEEWMLLANKTIAHFIHKKKFAFPYRTHDTPDQEKFKQLTQFLSTLDTYSSIKKLKPTPQHIKWIHQQAKNIPQENLIHQLSIRTMSKAKYTATCSGHFGLGFHLYTHFTSPIRRYADIIVHRIVEHILLDKKYPWQTTALEKKCQHISHMERIALTAERESIKHKQIIWMIKQEEKKFRGTIVSIVSWGIYIAIEGIGCEGLVRFAEMSDDHYSIDHKNFAIKGKKTKKKYQLGQMIDVKIKSYDLEQRSVDLQILI